MIIPETYSIDEVARILGMSRPTISRRIDDGDIPAIRIGIRRVVPRAYIDRLFEDAGCPREVSPSV